jgi:hypothetical protein
MANYAVIKGNIVDNVVVADSLEVAEMVTGLPCVEYEHAIGAPGIGWSYDGNTFTAPVVPKTDTSSEVPTAGSN